GNVFRLDFIDPKRGKRGQSGANGVGRAGGVKRAGWILDRLNVLIAANAVEGKADRQDVAIGAGQIPVAERVRRVGDERPQVLPNRRGEGCAGGAGNDVQTVVAGMFDRTAGSGAGQIGRKRPGTWERRFETAVVDVGGADVRRATRHQVQVVEVNVARRIQVDVEPRSARRAGGGDALPLRRGIGARVDRSGRPIGHARVVLRRVD